MVDYSQVPSNPIQSKVVLPNNFIRFTTKNLLCCGLDLMAKIIVQLLLMTKFFVVVITFNLFFFFFAQFTVWANFFLHCKEKLTDSWHHHAFNKMTKKYVITTSTSCIYSLWLNNRWNYKSVESFLVQYWKYVTIFFRQIVSKFFITIQFGLWVNKATISAM